MTPEEKQQLKSEINSLKKNIIALEQVVESINLKGKKDFIVNSRCCFAFLYFLLGLIFLFLFLFCFPDSQKIWDDIFLNRWAMLWCVSWSLIGIGLGLWNDRNKIHSLSHYITYFIFVLFISSLAAFIAFSVVSSYASAALTAITIGFVGDGLAGAIMKLSK